MHNRILLTIHLQNSYYTELDQIFVHELDLNNELTKKFFPKILKIYYYMVMVIKFLVSLFAQLGMDLQQVNDVLNSTSF